MAKEPRNTVPLEAGQKKIGRGNASQRTQFKKGGNANPGGRPKGSKNLASLIMEAANDQVSVTVDGQQRRISKAQATAMQLATKAASGEQKAIAQFLDWIDKIEAREAAKKPSQFPLGPADLEVLHAVYDRMKQCEPGKPK